MALIHFLPIPFLVLFVGLGLLIAFLVGLFKAGSAGRWILLGLLVLPVLIFGVLFMHGSMWHVARPVAYVEQPLTAFEVPNQINTEDNVFWQDHLEEELIPDTYSSLERAAYGLGTQLHDTIEEAIGQSPAKIRILEISSFDKSVLNEFRDGLKSQYEQAEITFGPRWGGPLSDDAILISLEKHEENDYPIHLRFQPSPNHTQETSFLSGSVTGNLEATVETKKGKFFKTVSYDHRLWLWDFESFQSKAGRSDFLVSLSDETATSDEEARDQALGKAAEELSSQIRNANPILPAFSPVTKEDLIQKGFIADEYSQKLAGMAGPIWRHAVLLYVSPESLQSLVSVKTEVVRVQRYTWLRSMLSLGGMLLLVCIVYIFANAATKGYYSTVLAIAAVMAAVFLGLLILNYA